MPATPDAHPRRRRRRRRDRSAQLKARIDAVAFALVIAAGIALLVYLYRVPPERPPAKSSDVFRPAVPAEWGDCAVVKTACMAHDTPFTVVGLGANKCETRFVCSTATGQQFVAGICRTVGEDGC